MITVKYDILFRFTVRHDFYESGLSEDFQFIPTPSTENMLQQYGLLFRSNPTGFTVFTKIDPDQVTPTVLTAIPADQKHFSFLMILKNPYFFNFTRFTDHPSELPPAMGREVLYASNVFAPAPGGDERPLGDHVVLPAFQYPALVRSRIYNLPYPSATNSSSPVLQDILTNTYTPLAEIDLPVGQQVQELQLDFGEVQSMTAGRYRLTASSPDIDLSFFYEPDLNGQEGVMGIIDIYNDTTDLDSGNVDQVPAEYKYLTGNQLTRNSDELIADYSLSFEAGRYRLVYVIHIKTDLTDTTNIPEVLNGLLPTNLRVQYPNPPSGTVTFQVPVVDGNIVRIVSDQTDIPWSETPEQFVLVRTDPAITTIKSLPSPSIFHPVKRESGTNNLIQEIHVHI